MALSSLASGSRQLVVAMRMKTPVTRNAVNQFRQSKRQMSEGFGGKPIAESLRQIQEVSAGKVGAAKQKFSSLYQPVVDRLEALPFAGKVGLTLLAAVPAIALPAYYVVNTLDRVKRKEEPFKQRLPAPAIMFPQAPSLVNLQKSAPFDSQPETEHAPCEDCAAEPLSAEGPTETKATPMVNMSARSVVSEKDDEANEVIVPETMSHETTTDSKSDSDVSETLSSDNQIGKRRRRKSKAAAPEESVEI